MRYNPLKGLFGAACILLVGFSSGIAQPLEDFLQKTGVYEPDHTLDSLDSSNPFLSYRYFHDLRILALIEVTIPKYYDQGKLDSIEMIILHSRGRFPHARTGLDILEFLLQIEMDKFADVNLNPDIWFQLAEFRSIRQSQNHRDYQFPPGNIAFFEFVEKVAKALEDNPAADPSAKLIIHHVAGDYKAAQRRIQSSDYRGTRLEKYYYQTVASELKQDAGGQLAVFGGPWLPFGANNRLGTHPEAGALFGWRFGRIHFELIYGWRFGRSKVAYLRPGDQAGDSTRIFQNWFAGIDAGKLLVRKRWWDCSAVIGVGVESMDTISSGDNRASSRFDLNLGLRQRLFFERHRFWFVGLQERLHPFYFRNAGGTDLSGSSLSITLMLGLDVDHGLIRSRKYLGYSGWRDTAELIRMK